MTQIAETASGFEFGGKPYSSLVEALEAARAAECPSRDPVFAEDGRAVGVFRWLDAASVERAEDFPGGHIDDVTIHEMAASLNRSAKPVPIDGGYVEGMAPSAVHGTAEDTGTPANGWAHCGVSVLRADGALHLFLYSELWPSVAVEVDRGRIAYGSVLLTASSTDEGGGYRGVRLMGHALTNDPANRRLSPSTAIRADSVNPIVMRATSSRLRGVHMPKSTKAAAAADETVKRDAAVTKAAELEVETETEAPAEDDKDKMIAELQARVAELSSQLEAMMAEAEARAAADAETSTKKAAADAAAREAEIQNALDVAIRDGRILAASRARFEKVARDHGVESFRSLISGLRAIPTRQTAARAEAPKPAALDPKDPRVVAMRGAGMTDNAIAAHLAASKES